MNLLFKISYGLFVLCAKAGKEESGCIINTFSQQTSMPETFSVTVNKRNFSHDLVEQSGECVVAILSTETDFETIKRFGMQSGRSVDKFDGIDFKTTSIGIKVPYTKGVLGYFALKVLKTVDMGTHTMFVLSAVENEAFVEIGDALTYDYYQNHIKPKPEIICIFCRFGNFAHKQIHIRLNKCRRLFYTVRHKRAIRAPCGAKRNGNIK